MAFSSCFCHSLISLKIDYSKHIVRSRHRIVKDQISSSSLKSNGIGIFGQQVARIEGDRHCGWSFLGGSRIINRPQLTKSVVHQKPSGIHASWLTNSQIANGVFSLGTVAVLPFYTLMVVAPKAELTRKTVESSIPYIVLGLLYAYLLFLSWTPDTFRLMFASKYWLPEIFSLPACLIQLPGIAKMFSSDMTLASAWIHLLAVDLFAARHVFQDGLENEVETRHSVSLCLLFCPIGIFTHFITKALIKQGGSTRHGIN